MSQLQTLIVRVDCSTVRVGVKDEGHNISEFISGAVGGLFAHVTLRSDLDFWCNDNGIALGLPINEVATALYDQPIFGDVVFMGGTDSSGEPLSLGTNHATAIELLSAMARA